MDLLGWIPSHACLFTQADSPVNDSVFRDYSQEYNVLEKAFLHVKAS